MELYAKQVKNGTKKQAQLVAAHNRATYTDIMQCYSRPSADKKSAFKDCISKKLQLDGYQFRINSFNGCMFQVSFLYVDSETGVVKLYTITKERDYVCDYI